MRLLAINEIQGHTALKEVWAFLRPLLKAGKRFWIIIQLESKTRPQEKKYHAMIGEITKQAMHQGAQWDEESWKRFLLDQFASDTNRPGGRVTASLDGKRVVQLGIQSRDFTIEDGNEFIEWLHCWAANAGIEFAHVDGSDGVRVAP